MDILHSQQSMRQQLQHDQLDQEQDFAMVQPLHQAASAEAPAGATPSDAPSYANAAAANSNPASLPERRGLFGAGQGRRWAASCAVTSMSASVSFATSFYGLAGEHHVHAWLQICAHLDTKLTVLLAMH